LLGRQGGDGGVEHAGADGRAQPFVDVVVGIARPHVDAQAESLTRAGGDGAVAPVVPEQVASDAEQPRARRPVAGVAKATTDPPGLGEGLRQQLGGDVVAARLRPQPLLERRGMALADGDERVRMAPRFAQQSCVCRAGRHRYPYMPQPAPGVPARRAGARPVAVPLHAQPRH
jgi:hypothetical protein